MPIDRELAALVRDDLLLAFAAGEDVPDRGTGLPPVGGRRAVRILDEFGTLTSDTHGAVVWSYTGRNTEPFLGHAPTGRTIRVDGVTIVSTDGGEPAFHRIIDWHSVFRQMGVAGGGRPVTALPKDFDHDPDPSDWSDPWTQDRADTDP
jgi:hypothetical protein